MTNSFLLYLAEASFCLGIFAGAYRLLFSRLTHFQWSRLYLLGSVLLSTVLPLVALPAGFIEFGWSSSPAELISPSPFRVGLVFSALPLSDDQGEGTVLTLERVGYLLLSIYALGFFYQAWGIQRNLRTIYRLVRHHPKVREGRCWLVYTRQDLPAFSFLNYVFLSPGHRQLSDRELHQIKQHERIHAAQHHTLDLLLLEAVGTLFWFNPVVGYLKDELRQVHEYLADSGVIGRGENRRAYATLLIKLTTRETPVPLANGFAGKQLHRRITVLTQTPSTPMKKLKFLIALPLVAFALVCCSLAGNGETPPDVLIPPTAQSAASDLRIGKVIWQGNTLYQEDELNWAFGLKTGDTYVKEAVDQRLDYVAGATDVTSLYMDRGYLFFEVKAIGKPTNNGTVDLTITLYEGQPTRIRNVRIKGNGPVSREEIRQRIAISPGELFSRSKLMQAQRTLAAMGTFDPNQIAILPLPDQRAVAGKANGTTDLEINLNFSGLEPLGNRSGKAANTPRPPDIRLLLNGKEVDQMAGIPANSTGSFSVEIPDEASLQKTSGEKIGINFTLARGSRPITKEKKLASYRELATADMSELFSIGQPGDRIIFEFTGTSSPRIFSVSLR